MQNTISNSQRHNIGNIKDGHRDGNYYREGKIYRRVLRQFAKTLLKQMEFNACPNCGCLDFVHPHNYLPHIDQCKRCRQPVKPGEKTANKKQLRIIKCMVREIGVLSRRPKNNETTILTVTKFGQTVDNTW